MSKIKIQKKKLCIYLDQFAVSDMIDSADSHIWGQIKNKLLSLHSQGLIFCPLSSEHYFETSQKKFAAAQLHDSFFAKLSDGYCIKPEVFITSQLISSRIRKNNITLKTYMYDNVANSFESETSHHAFDSMHKKLQGLVIDAAADINQLRQATNKQKMDATTKAALISAMKNIQPRKFIKRLQELEKAGAIIIRPDIIGTTAIPNWIDLVIDQLLKKHIFKKTEIQKLITEFEKFGFQNIPTLDVKFTLMALMSVYSKGEKPSDHIDLMRISNGLPISDYLFTDRRRKAEIIESKIHEKYNTKIYSGMEDDLISFLEEMNKIQSAHNASLLLQKI